MSKIDVFVSVVAPLQNDQGSVAAFVSELLPILCQHYTNYELLLVDDGSEDGTVDEVQKLLTQEQCLRLIRLSRRFGLEVAITAGLESAIGDFVVVMLPETDPPALIPEMVARCRNGLGIVNGVSSEPRRRSFCGNLLASLFHWYLRRFLGIDLVPNSKHFRVLSRQAINAATQIKGQYRQLRLLASTIGFKKYNFVYQPIHRTGRQEITSLWTEIGEGIDLLVLNSIHPLRFVSILGLLGGTLNLLYLGYVVLIFLFKSDVMPGWTTLSLQHGIMFFLIFVILSVVCEYIGRILDSSREQPLYFVLDEKNSSVLLSDATRRNIMEESK